MFETVQDDEDYYDGLIVSRIRALMTLDDIERPLRTLCGKDAFFTEPTRKSLMNVNS